MMSMLPAKSKNTSLSPRGCVRRLIAVVTLATILLLVRATDPVVAGTWLPFHTSCGAVTGLPCIFCGMTRALHFLLKGDFARALYFNWLAFPLIAAVIRFGVLLTIEIALQRTLLNLRPVAPITSTWNRFTNGCRALDPASISRRFSTQTRVAQSGRTALCPVRKMN